MELKPHTTIFNLQAIRGLGALIIFLHHCGIDHYAFVSFGDFGVSLFFIISGCVMTMSGHSRPLTSFGGSIRFILHRLIRIYPVYLACLALQMILFGDKIDIKVAIIDLLMLQSWIPNPDIYFSGNSVSWFVSSLMFCYVMFLPMHYLMRRNIRCFHAVSFIILASYLTAVVISPENKLQAIIYIFPPMQFTAFLAGMYAFILYTKFRSLQIRHAGLLQSVVILMTIATVYFYDSIPLRCGLALYWWPLDILIILTFSLTDKSATPLNALFHSRTMQTAGTLSYSFYMIHIIAIQSVNALILKHNSDISATAVIIIYFIVASVAAYIMYRAVEKPSSAKLSKLLKHLPYGA